MSVFRIEKTKDFTIMFNTAVVKIFSAIIGTFFITDFTTSGHVDPKH